MGCCLRRYHLRVILVCLAAIPRSTDGVGITWYEPLPAETISDVNLYHTNSTQLLEGATNATLNWNFSLTSDLSFNSLNLKFNDENMGGVLSSGQAGLIEAFTERFDFIWIPNQKATLRILSATSNESGTYDCVVSTYEGFDNKVWTSKIQVDIVDPPNITHTSGNQTVNQSDIVSLSCTADGSPAPNITWTRLSDNTIVNSSLNITGKQDEGYYRCTADNGVGSPDNRTIFIFVENYHPINTQLSTNLTNNTVAINKGIKLTCSAQANPPAKYRFFDSLLNSTFNSFSSVYTTSVNERIKKVTYSCTPFNYYGDGLTQKTTVVIHYPPTITKPQNNIFNVTAGDDVNITCKAEGNPDPHFVWTNVTSGDNITNDGHLHLRQVYDSGNFTCIANNLLGSAFITVLVKVRTKTVYGRMTVNAEFKEGLRDLRSEVSKLFWGPLENGFDKEYENNTNYNGTEPLKFGKGSVIVIFALHFKILVTVDEGISELRSAVERGNIGPYTVSSLQILQVGPGITQPVSPTVSSASTTAPVSPTVSSASTTPVTTAPAPSDGPPWVVIGAVIGGVVVFAIIVAVVTWCVHKKRKCRRKDTKIHHSESEEQQAFSRQEGQLGAEDSAYSRVSHGYAGTGPRPNGTEAVAPQQKAAANGSDSTAQQQTAAAIPTYAVVDKSKKKKKKEEKLDSTYAEVDSSKKTKKKTKPGEMIYADLEDVNVPRPMPTVSTSPQPLPLIKRPEPYENTQYADVTQFLKGDATLPQSDSNQGTELQPQGANKDEDSAGGEDRNTPM